MKVKDFDPYQFIYEKQVGFMKQAEKLHRLFGLVESVAPEAEVRVKWYGLNQSLDVVLYGKDVLKDAPAKLAEQGIELKKTFDSYNGDFDYSFEEGIGTLSFSSLPPNCKLVKKTKVHPARDAYTSTYFEVECDGEKMGEEESESS